MRTDDPEAIAGALGLLEDDLDELQGWYPEFAGKLAAFERWETRESVKVRQDFLDRNKWPKGTTETQKKKDVQDAMVERYPDRYREIEEIVELKAKGDKLFQLIDTRRSIGQTLMKMHVADQGAAGERRYGQQAHGQRGVGPDG